MSTADRPRLLLVPEFSLLEWQIMPQLEEWAEVAAFDPPGVGDEPLAEEDLEAVREGRLRIRDLIVRRGLEEIERRGWERFFLVADGWSNATAARIAVARPEAVEGIALGHACVSYEMDGERPAISREVWAAMRQLLQNDHREFIRHGIVQVTRGSVGEEIADRMIERFPSKEWVLETWDALGSDAEPIGELLKEAGSPLLLAQHEGCISFTEEGFEDAAEAFPDAPVIRVPDSPAARPEFAEALREFCLSVSRARQSA